MRIVVFDIGGVLCHQGLEFAMAAELLSCQAEALEAAYWAHRDAYDLGQSSEEYWACVASDCGVAAPEAATLERLIALDGERWSKVSEHTQGMIDSLVEQGVELALLSNAPAPLTAVVKDSQWSGDFKHRIFSSDCGVMKPDPKIYGVLLGALGIEPSQTLFFDDRKLNVEAARTAGMRAEVFDGVEKALAVIRAQE